MTGPPAESEYGLGPVGVATISPSACEHNDRSIGLYGKEFSSQHLTCHIGHNEIGNDKIKLFRVSAECLQSLKTAGQCCHFVAEIL